MNYGQLWLELDSTDRNIFLLGLRDGILYSGNNILSDDTSGLKDLSDIKKEMLSVYIFKRYNDFNDNMFVLKDIITSLYKEPANSYIRYIEMIDIAMKRLKGEDIEPLLQKAREEALSN
jgi:hypothetical protein